MEHELSYQRPSFEDVSSHLNSIPSRDNIQYEKNNISDENVFIQISLSKSDSDIKPHYLWTQYDFKRYYDQGNLIEKMKMAQFSQNQIHEFENLQREQDRNKAVLFKLRGNLKLNGKYVVIHKKKTKIFNTFDKAIEYANLKRRDNDKYHYMLAYIDSTSPRGGINVKRTGCVIL